MISFHVFFVNASLCFMDPFVVSFVIPKLASWGEAYLVSLQIRDTDSTLVVAQLLFLEAEEQSKPIHFYINSPGGSVTAGLAIYDTVSQSFQNLSPLTLFCLLDAGRDIYLRSLVFRTG